MPTSPQELVRWVPAGHEQPFISEVDVCTFSGNAWDNLRVCRKVTRGRFAMPPGYVATDLVAIVLRAPACEEMRFGQEYVRNRGGRGSVNILPAGTPYTYTCDGTREVLHISITREVNSQCDDGHVALRPTFAQTDPLIVQIGSALLSEATSGPNSDRLYGEALASALGAHLARRYSAKAQPLPSVPTCIPIQQLQRVLDYIEAHLAENLGLGQLARTAGMSRTQFLGNFKRTTGTTPHQYVTARRMERAKKLLADPDVQLHEVASMAGYSDQASFTRVFRRIARTTPGAYRALSNC